MSNTSLYIHCVWVTKYRRAVLYPAFRLLLFDHIKEYAKENGIKIDSLNGVEDHIHLLIHLRSDQQLDKIMQVLKGESSHWINATKALTSSFSWGSGYFAVSVSPVEAIRVRSYIHKQEEYHKNSDFRDESGMFRKIFGYGLDEPG
jgi:REP element-mobilizing transposase RayT